MTQPKSATKVLLVLAVAGMLLHARPARANEAEAVLYFIGAAVAGPVCLTGSAICLGTESNCPTLGKCSVWSSFAWMIGGTVAAVAIGRSEVEWKETGIAVSVGAAALGVAMVVVGGFCWANSEEEESAMYRGGVVPIVVADLDGRSAPGLGLHFAW